MYDIITDELRLDYESWQSSVVIVGVGVVGAVAGAALGALNGFVAFNPVLATIFGAAGATYGFMTGIGVGRWLVRLYRTWRIGRMDKRE